MSKNYKVADTSDTPPGSPFQGARRSPLEQSLLPGGHTTLAFPSGISQSNNKLLSRKIFTIVTSRFLSFVTRRNVLDTARAGPRQLVGARAVRRQGEEQQDEPGSRKRPRQQGKALAAVAGKTLAAGRSWQQEDLGIREDLSSRAEALAAVAGQSCSRKTLASGKTSAAGQRPRQR